MNLLFVVVAWRVLLNHSSMMTKRKGDRGSPYLILLEGPNGFEGDPLTRMAKKAPETKVMIH